MRKKASLLWIWIAVILVLCLTAATMAFLTRQAVTDNVLTFGELEMVLRQTTVSAEGEEIPVSGESAMDITNHNAVSRILRVENTGDHPMFVRVALTMNGTDADGKDFDAGEYVSYDLNETDWIYQDGWFYYRGVLAPHETTNALMTQIIFDDINTITQKYPGSRFDMDVDAQAVQSENNAEDALTAVGWPEQ